MQRQTSKLYEQAVHRKRSVNEKDTYKKIFSLGPKQKNANQISKLPFPHLLYWQIFKKLIISSIDESTGKQAI